MVQSAMSHKRLRYGCPVSVVVRYLFLALSSLSGHFVNSAITPVLGPRPAWQKWEMFAGNVQYVHAGNETAVRRMQMEKGQASACQSLFTMPPPSFIEYENCFNRKMQTADLSIPGIAIDIRASCSCENNIAEALEALGCCAHSEFKIMCEIRCNPDCNTTSAQNCQENCPALCLEEEYAPPSCAQTCIAGECHKDLLCITRQSKDNPKDRVCHERDFGTSKEVQAYHQCQAKHSHRSVWQRHSAALHCICDSNMVKAAANTQCCGTSWGGAVCNLDCSPDCKSAEGQQCLKDCREKCDQKPTGETDNSVTTTADCYSHCLVQGGTCSRYAVCPPQSYPDYPYVCDDGAKPLKNGCCESNPLGPSGSACPQMCKLQQSFPIPEKDGHECFCDGCPQDMEETVARYEASVENELHENGVFILAMIARDAGLRYPNKKMKELMDERNKRIMDTLKDKSISLAEKERKINDLNMQYVAKIKEAAKLGPDKADDSEDKDESGFDASLLLVIAIVALVIACSAIVIGCYLVRKYKRAATPVMDLSVKTPEEIRQAAEQLQQANDSMTVVIGQPVAGSTQGAATGQTQGVPRAQKGEVSKDNALVTVD